MFSYCSFGISPLVPSPTLPEILLWRPLLWRPIIHSFKNQSHTYYLVWFSWSPNLKLTQYEVLNLDGVLTSSSPWSGRTEASSYNSSRSCPLRWSPFFLSISNCWLVISYSRIFLDHSSPGKRLKLPNHVVRL